MNIIRTEQIWIKENDTISKFCHISKNLYNETNYAIRQEFFNSGKWIRYSELNKLFKENENYKVLPAQTAQQILKIEELIK